MELFLHIGTNKTGSSFLQSLITYNKLELKEQGIYVPSSKWDIQILNGQISPGNGHQLAWFLATESKKKLIYYLKRIKKEAETNKCGKILLSNEVIIRLFSNPAIFKLLSCVCRETGFKKLHSICFLRPPFAHALSLYKHRAKLGLYPNYYKWFAEDYETMRLMKKFLENLSVYDCEWCFQLYKKDTDYLLSCFFSTFLNIDETLIKLPEYKFVNQSISLDEIYLLQIANSLKPNVGYYIYDQLNNLRLQSKDSSILRNLFFQAADKYLSNYFKTIQQLSELLDKESQIIFLEKPVWGKSAYSHNLTLTAQHFKLISLGLESFERDKNRLYMTKIYYKCIQIFKNKYDKSVYGGSLRSI